MIAVMQKKTTVFFLLLGACFFSSPAFPAETQPAAGEMQLKYQMRSLRDCFDRLEAGLSKKPPAYDDLIATLDEMADHARQVQKMKPAGHPGKKFNRLFGDIGEFRKNAKAKNASGVEDSMNRLAENCFRCHLSHSE